ncbi:allophanate hydrolase [Labrys wisconsinensis]|uniref:Allophanate hydrolase n=2 Tax=Labrys wisconsinensis TaxID=425677 RepID=A0ABU0J0F5_9HYPH|nr:allophanate hydrolase [Labrys wisconsinensis]
MVPASFDIASLHAAYRAGLDPVRVVEAAFARIAAADDPGIFISLAEKSSALAAAAALGPFDPAAKPLWGIPFAVKDNIDVAGLPTTAACPAYLYQPAESAAAVQRLVEAGAIPIGKTNLDQFATGLVGVRTPYPVPRNPFDAGIIPGGSSSGSAVAVARGLVSFALGTDTAGSGRVPAGLNNLVGLKPSLGTVPVHGVVPACKSLDCVSVFALTVADAWVAYAVMAGADPRDPWSKPAPAGAPGAVPPGLRIGVPDAAGRRFDGDGLSERAFDGLVAGDLAAFGGRVRTVDLTPLFEVANLLYGGAWVAERYQAIRGFFEASPEALHPVTRHIIGGATALSAADAFAGLYRLRELAAASEALWRDIDVLVVPTLPRPYRLAELEADPIGPNTQLGVYTNFVNLLNLCALAVPGRFREDGFPAGVTLIAPAGKDALLASIGARLQAASGTPLGATGLPQPPLPDRPAAALPGEVEIVVVGAHLSGMALNHELTAPGGRFLRQARTAASYRLYALAGAPPRRPGLVRCGAGEGHAIAVEVWALPAEGFGRFVAAVPAPLAIGTVLLEDGAAAKGFLCETAATAGAEDISAHGGWRAFVETRAA